MRFPKRQFSKSAYVRKANDQDVQRLIPAQHEYRHAKPARKGTPTALKVLEIEDGSVAERIGLAKGDEIIEVNGKPLVDVIDFQFEVAAFDEPVTLRTRAGTVEFVRREWESFGVELEPIEPFVCDNDCVFCFVHQNPGDVRKSLRVKDEDYRLSFLFGNYLTLTNVDEPELERIMRQRLSPLYLSVHATDPELRTRMLGNTSYDGLDWKMDRLAEAGIEMHCQVVLCPGWNDGRHLRRTIDDLVARHPAVRSLALVPVGLTDHRANLPRLTPVTPAYARNLIRLVSPLQQSFERRHGTPFVFLGDEFYIMAQVEIPHANHYREFPQIENGVGMVRRFLDQFADEMKGFRRPKRNLTGTVCTGKLFHGFLAPSVDRLGLDLRTISVESRFWGGGINVAGLLTGRDFVAKLKGSVHGDFVVLPSECMIEEQGLFLDDMTRDEVESILGVPVLGSGYSPGEFIQAIAAVSA